MGATRRTGGDDAGRHGGTLALLGLGLLGDAGEVADLLKKRLQDGSLDRDHLAHELGDVAYYWARLCAVTGITPSELLDRNRHSIEARLAKRAQG
jgi:NTP pyrophosphatase (non-canonical NTP hydrolase)